MYLLFFFISGVDEDSIIKILTNRTNGERQQIKAAYQQQTGKVSITCFLRKETLFLLVVKNFK